MRRTLDPKEKKKKIFLNQENREPKVRWLK